MLWTIGGGGSRDISKVVLKNKKLDIWQKNAEAYIDLLLEMSRPQNPKLNLAVLEPELLIITNKQLRGNNREAVDELVAAVLNDLAGYIRECGLLLNGRADNAFDEVKADPLSAPEQRRRVKPLSASLKPWQQFAVDSFQLRKEFE